ncbi:MULTISPECIES: hydrogenase maturation protease [Streptomyces]|uniref:Hydrogenase maturation protease n=1 Tax=Streptomyces fimbriatus TaxID=68197 RepID=A0ABW0DFE9_STRFI
MDARARIAVVGAGNGFRRDGGVGRAVVARLRERAGSRPLPPGTVPATCGGDPTGLIGLREDAGLAVVADAAHTRPGSPGRTHRPDIDGERLGRPPTTGSHGLGEAVELARVPGRLPGHLAVYAVEGADRSLGTGLSSAVADVVEPLAASVEEEIVRHRTAMAGGGPP